MGELTNLQKNYPHFSSYNLFVDKKSRSVIHTGEISIHTPQICKLKLYLKQCFNVQANSNYCTVKHPVGHGKI